MMRFQKRQSEFKKRDDGAKGTYEEWEHVQYRRPKISTNKTNRQQEIRRKNVSALVPSQTTIDK
jgi:hypothetical protein